MPSFHFQKQILLSAAEPMMHVEAGAAHSEVRVPETYLE